jgi:osmotically-inducible protein OsmY
MTKRLTILIAFLLIAGLMAPVALRADDDDIYDHVNAKLNADVDIHGRVKIDVKNGVVTLTGVVHTEKAKDKAVKLTKKVQGVKDVVNKIEVGEEKTPR